MIYSLTCGDCRTENLVDSEWPVTEWVCSVCESKSVSSLPTTDGATLVTDVSLPNSLVALDDTGITDPIVQGGKV